MLNLSILKKDVVDGNVYLLIECTKCGFKYWMMPEEETLYHDCNSPDDSIQPLHKMIYGK